MPHENSFRPTPKSGLRWLIVAAKPPTHWLRLSALTTRPCVLARVERGHNVSTNVFYNGNTTARFEPSLDHLLDGPVKRWQRLLLVPRMLRPIPLILRAERKRVCPRSIPVIAVPACLLLPGLFGRSQFDGRPQLAVGERFDEFFKGRDRRVPGALHRDRNGSYDRGERPRGESIPRIQGPLEVAGQSGAAARVEEQELLWRVVGGGRSMALHRLDVDHPRQVHGVQLLLGSPSSHGIHPRSSITSAANSPLQ